MVFPSQANEVKNAILQALEKCTSAEKGIGYNKLFDVVNNKVGGSRRTFHKYLNELVSAGAVKKDKDPRHKAGVIIYRTDSATQEEALIELAERLATIIKMPPIVKRFIGDERMDSAPDSWKRAWKLILLSDVLGRLLANVMPNPKPGWYASGRITEDKRIVIDLTSENGTGTGKVELSFSDEKLTKPRLYETIWKGYRRELPVSSEAKKK